MSKETTKAKTETTTAAENDNGRADRKAARAARRDERAAAAAAAAQTEKKNALRGDAPKANTTNTTEQELKKFEKMTYKERLNLFNTNPQVYNKLTKGG